MLPRVERRLGDLAEQQPPIGCLVLLYNAVAESDQDSAAEGMEPGKAERTVSGRSVSRKADGSKLIDMLQARRQTSTIRPEAKTDRSREQRRLELRETRPRAMCSIAECVRSENRCLTDQRDHEEGQSNFILPQYSARGHSPESARFRQMIAFGKPATTAAGKHASSDSQPLQTQTHT